ncbi:hypothetical protein [Staphylococcus felis]|uniref:hypothetical protein n=1 Tax=Staphylococcus felis TaxID=46127 RepID=UPI001EE7BB3D|nr:hypothetical protein [Staphylococcus felis]
MRSYAENSAIETPSIKVVEQVVRIQAEWNDEQNCFPNFVKLCSSVEKSACEPPLIEL